MSIRQEGAQRCAQDRGWVELWVHLMIEIIKMIKMIEMIKMIKMINMVMMIKMITMTHLMMINDAQTTHLDNLQNQYLVFVMLKLWEPEE